MLLLARFNNSKSNNDKGHRLWSDLKNGHREALAELFQLHHQHLYNYGINIVPNSEIVDEAIQELFLNLWNSRDRLSPANSVKAYLLSSLRRLILKQIKREKKRAERNRNYMKNQEELTFPVENLLISKEVAFEKREQLQQGLKTLTPRQKEAIFLKFYHGLTNKELVEVMEINYQCVRNLLYEALERLRSNVELVSYQD